jgi:hypothetical protein
VFGGITFHRESRDFNEIEFQCQLGTKAMGVMANRVISAQGRASQAARR